MFDEDRFVTIITNRQLNHLFSKVSNAFLWDSSRLHKASACSTFDSNFSGFAEMQDLLVSPRVLKGSGESRLIVTDHAHL